MTWASISRARSQRASQKPSRPASKAIAIRSILCPAFSACSRQRLSSFSNALSSTASFFNGERSTPGTIPATSQLDWPISITAISVASCSRITRDLLKSFSCGMGRSVDSLERRWCHCPRRSPHSIFFGALHTLTVDDGGGGTGFAFRPFAAFDIERVMNAIQHAVALPPDEVVIHRAVWRKILRKIAPLTTGAQDIHQAVYHRTHVGAALTAARPRRRNEWLNNRPLPVREVARVSQMITIVSRPVFLCPHRRLSPTNQTASFETQMIPMTPQVLRRTLRVLVVLS